jgi:hypothetical protein
MITVTAHYGNHNRYDMEVPSDTELGYLPVYLTEIIKKESKSVLYLVMGGHVIGGGELPFAKTLSECNIICNRCVVSIIFRDPKIKYPEADLYINSRHAVWLEQQKRAHTQAQAHASTDPFSTLLQAIGTELIDVIVTLTDDEYEQVITRPEASPDDVCSICSRDIESSDCVKLVCGHEFHDGCAREWLTTSSIRCPHCNHDVRTQ